MEPRDRATAVGSEPQCGLQQEVRWWAHALPEACRLTSVFLNRARSVFITPAGASTPVSEECVGG